MSQFHNTVADVSTQHFTKWKLSDDMLHLSDTVHKYDVHDGNTTT